MKRSQSYADIQPNYKYQLLGNGYADVFIFKFIEEIIDEENGNSSFIYDTNEFRVNTDEITEEMISESPLDWIHYSNIAENISIEDRVSAIEDAVMELIIGGSE